MAALTLQVNGRRIPLDCGLAQSQNWPSCSLIREGVLSMHAMFTFLIIRVALLAFTATMTAVHCI